MGVSSPVIQGGSGVNYKTVSSNHYLGIWRGFEKHGPVELGSSITPKYLYGEPLNKLTAKNEFAAVTQSSIGAISEIKNVDNRVVYNKITSKYDNTKNKKIDVEESKLYFPPLYDMATITVNANNTIGLIYEATYKPVDGLFHNKSYAFHNRYVIQRKPYEVNVDLADEGKIDAATYVLTDPIDSNKAVVSYEDATIDNMFFRSLKANHNLSFVDGLGIGMLPKRSKDDKNIDANLEIAVHTEIKIKAEAFGGNVLSSGEGNRPQSNPNKVFFLHKKKKFGNAYAANGLPTLENSSNDVLGS